ncbi:hypothetical protein EAE96_005155 [Botrytis aclada]|nr:hypothetical protein EAE96_005155 [Botrytis aclada]
MQIINFLPFAFLLSDINALYLSAEQHPITPPSSLLLPPSPKQPIPQPLIGFGTWNLNISPENTTEAVAYAIEIGYRQIDCAAAYGNEVAVGQGIKEGLKRAGLERKDIWVTSKLWNDHHGSYENVEKGLNQTLQDLNLEYLDLYLIHWPIGFSSNGTKNPDHVQTYKSMLSLPKSWVLNIGVSNFSPLQLKNVVSTGTMPYMHQMELHPYLQQSAWVATHKALGIKMTAYSPLGNTNPTYHSSSSPPLSTSSSSWTSWTSLFRPSSSKPKAPPLLQNPILLDIAEQRNCTPAQVALKWNMGRGISVIPKSSHEEWIKENLQAGECELTHADLTKLRFVGRKWLSRFNNPGEEWGVTLFEGLDGV